MSDDSGGETRIEGDAIGGDKKVAGHEIHAQTVNVYPGASVPAASAAPARGWYRPPMTSHYVARGIEQDVCAALQRDGSAAIVSVYAPGSAGKTEMASRICGELEGQFEHVWWIDCGDKNPSQTLAQLALVMGLHFSSEQYAAQIVELENFLGGRRDLLVFDDVRAKNRALLDDFAPPAHNALLVTSRLRELSHNVKRKFHLGEMTDAQAKTLLTSVLGPVRVQIEADAVKQLIERCARNPLALDIATARILEEAEDEARELKIGMPTHIARFVARLENRLQELKMVAGARRNLEAVLDISYDDLSADDRARFRKLGACAASGFGLNMAAALWGDSADEARNALRRLRNMSLAKLLDSERQRYRLHDLLDDYALDKLQKAGEEKATRDAHAEWLIDLFDAHYTTNPESRPYVEPELDNLSAAARWALDSQNGDLLARVATKPRNWLYNFFRVNQEWLMWLTSALELGISDRWLQANTLRAIGDVQKFRDENDAALASYQQALALFQAVGERLGEAYTRRALGLLELESGNKEHAMQFLEQAVNLHQMIGDPYSVAVDYWYFAVALDEKGMVAETKRCAEIAAPIFEKMGLP